MLLYKRSASLQHKTRLLEAQSIRRPEQGITEVSRCVVGSGEDVFSRFVPTPAPYQPCRPHQLVLPAVATRHSLGGGAEVWTPHPPTAEYRSAKSVWESSAASTTSGAATRCSQNSAMARPWLALLSPCGLSLHSHIKPPSLKPLWLKCPYLGDPPSITVALFDLKGQ